MREALESRHKGPEAAYRLIYLLRAHGRGKTLVARALAEFMFGTKTP